MFGFYFKEMGSPTLIPVYHKDVVAECRMDWIGARMEEDYQKGSMWPSRKKKVVTWAKVVVVGMDYNKKLDSFVVILSFICTFIYSTTDMQCLCVTLC